VPHGTPAPAAAPLPVTAKAAPAPPPDAAAIPPARHEAVAGDRPPPARRAGGRIASACGRLLLLALSIVLVAGAAAWFALSRGPVSFESLPERVAEALEAQFGHGYDVNVDAATINWESGGPSLAVTGVEIRDAKGALVIGAPQAVIGFDPWSLPVGRLVPRDISFVGLAVALTIAPDGSVSISAGGSLPARGAPARVQPRDTSFGPGAVLDALLANDGPVAVLERAGVRGGNLRIDDQRRGSITDYADFDLSNGRDADGAGRLALSARGPSGRWAATAGLRGTPGAERSLRLETRNLALSDLISLARPGAVPLQTDMPVSAELSLTVGADGGLVSLDGRLDGEKSLVLLEDPDAEPIFVDSLSSAFGWDAASRSLLLKNFVLDAGQTHWNLTGTVTPPSAGVDHWQLELASSGSTVAGDGPQDQPAVISSLALSGHMPIGLGALVVDRLAVRGPDLGIDATMAIGTAPGLDGFRLDMTASAMPVRKALAFWPSFIGAEVRSYLLDNVVSGTLKRLTIREDVPMQPFLASFQKIPLPDETVQLDFAVSDGVMTPAPGIARLSGIEATGRMTGHTAKVAIARATMSPSPGHTLVIGQGRFEVADTTRKPALAEIAFDVAGGADALVEALRADAFKAFTAMPPDMSNVKGQVEAKARVTLPLQATLTAKDVAVSLQGTVTNLSADGIAGKEKLEAGNLIFQQDRNGLTVKGDAKISGIPAQIDLAQPAGAPADVVLALVLDDAARARRGIRLPGQVTGPIDARVSLHDPGGPKSVQKVELDFAKASLADVVPGWTKPAGKPGKASFRLLTDGDATVLEDFAAEAYGGLLVKGSVRLQGDQGFASAKLSTLKLSPGDDVHADIDRQGAVTKLVLRGNAFDARPIIRALTTPGNTSVASPGDLDLDAKVGTVTGLNTETMGAADLKLGLRAGDFKDFRLTGRFGTSPVAGQIARLEGGGPGIVLESGDAGSTLRFLDIYRRMLGGTLLLTLAGPAPQMDGTLVINNFVLSNEPALAKSAPRGADAPDAANNVLFTKLKAGFGVGGGRLAIRDATMWGQSVGGTIDGTLDFTRDKADLSGTFVPAYGLNNIINSVPLVGPIIGGGQHEGLFAVNFRITGKVSQPTLSINPLSAVAPGILRKFFGVFSPEQTGSAGPTPVLKDAGR
jgi:hypothetical protein